MTNRIAAYQMVPTRILDEEQRADAAAAWGDAQRKDIAGRWAEMHLQDAEDSLGPLVRAAEEPVPPVAAAPRGGVYGTPEEAGPAPLDASTYQPENDRPPSEFDQPRTGRSVGGSFAPPAPLLPATALPQDPGRPSIEREASPAGVATAAGDVVGPGLNALGVPGIEQAAADRRRMMTTAREALPGDRPPTADEAGQAFGEPLTDLVMNVGPGGPAPGSASAVGARAIQKTEEMFADAASHAQTPLRSRLSALGTNLTRAVTDAGVDLSNLEQDAARTLGRPLRADEMASVQSRLNPFYTARVAVDEGIRPAINDLSDADYNAVRNALTWKGNIDVAAAKGAPDRAFSGGLSAAESDAALAEQARRLGPRAADVDRRVGQVVDFNKAELERDVAAGLVSREQADAWLAQYPNYTPVVIADYLKEQGRAVGSGKSLNVGGTGYKTLSAAGTSRARLDPIAASVDAAYQGEALRRQNAAWRALHDLIQATPEMADLFQVQKGGYGGATKHENSVSGYIDGALHTITTPFPDVAKAIRQEAGGVNIPGWSTAMALYKELITGRNPTFLVGNAAIDAPLAVLNTAMREGGAQHLLPIAVDLFKGYADAFKGIMSGQYTGQATRNYLAGGGGMGFYAAPSATTGATEIARLRRGSVLEVDSAADAGRLVKDLVTLNWVKGLGERVELGPRAMAYSRALKQGLAPEQAVLAGRTVTVDFAQGGSAAKIINSFVPFFNPAVQGVATTGRIVRDNPRGALLTLGPALVGPTLAAEAWNRADPERSKAYDDVPDYVKDRGVVVMLPGAPPVDEKGEPHPQFVLVNLRQLAPIAAMTREVYDRAAGRDGRTAADLLQGTLQQVSPVQDVSGLLPPLVTTGAELAANKDLYRRADIATARNDERASALSRAAATGTNAVLGTNVRPSQAEFAIRDTTGALGEMGTGASDMVAGRTKQSGTPQDVPGVGGFVRRVVRGDTGQQLQDARDARLSPALAAALRDAGLPPDAAVVGAEYRGIPLMRSEQAVYQAATNKHLEETLGPILAAPWFAKLPAAEKKKVVNQMVEAAHKMAGAEVMKVVPPGQIGERVRKKAS